jgi:outer membrane protein TolC
VAFTQPLLRGAWKSYATSTQRQAEIAWRRQIERRREARQQVLRSVHDAYWDLHAAGRQVEVRELSVSLGREQVEQNRRRLEVGVGTEVDVLQAETTVAEREQALIEARAELRAAEDRLRQATGAPCGPGHGWTAPWDAPIEPVTPLPEVRAAEGGARGDSAEPPEWIAAYQRAVENRPDLAQRRLDVETAEIDLVRARSERRSRLDLSLTASSGAVDVDPDQALESTLAYDFPTASVSLAYSTPLGNRAARNAVREKRAALRQSRLSFDRALLVALTEVRTGARALDSEAEAVEAARTRADLAERQLAAEAARFAEGLTTTFQVLDFQRQLAEALQAETAALAAHAKARAQLLAAEGRLSEDVAPWTE